VARDRQRAKQRKARRAQNPGSAQSRPQPSNPQTPLDHNVPSELGHLGEVDEFEAAIVSGSDRPADDASETFVEEEEPDAGRAALGDEDADAVADADEDLDEELEEQAVAAAPAERREVAPAGTPGAPSGVPDASSASCARRGPSCSAYSGLIAGRSRRPPPWSSASWSSPASTSASPTGPPRRSSTSSSERQEELF
jgi:hypothetical protein